MSVLDQVRDLERKVLGRLRELEPLMREYEQLRKAAQRLGVKYKPGTDTAIGEQASSSRRRTSSRSAARAAVGDGQAKATAAAKRAAGAAKRTSGPRRTAAAKTTATKTAPTKTTPARQGARRRRTAASPGQRREEVLRLVGENPGIKVSEIGKRLGVDSTGLYRVVRRLTDEGRLRKDGAQLHLAETQTPEPPAPAESKSAEATQ